MRKIKNLKKHAVYSIILLTVFASCEAILEVELKISNLLKSKNYTQTTSLYVEIAGCTDYENPNQPTKSLVEAQQKIPGVFTDAKYIECFTRDMKSYAHFSVPITINGTRSTDDQPAKYVDFSSNTLDLLYINIPPGILNGLERMKRESYGMSNFDLAVSIKIDNDTSDKFRAKVISAYVNNAPLVNEEFVIEPQTFYRLKLSKIAVDRALQKGSSQVLINRGRIQPEKNSKK